MRIFGSDFVSFFALSDGGMLAFLMIIFEKIRQAGNLKCDVQAARENDLKPENVGVFLNFWRGRGQASSGLS